VRAALQGYASNFLGFLNEVWIPTGRGPRVFGDCMTPFQERVFREVAPSLLAVMRQQSPPIPRIWDERVKGASKDTDWSLALLWLMAFCKRPLRIQVGAYDAGQADEVRQIVRDILRIDTPLNKFLRQVVEVQASKVVNDRTGSVIEILTHDKLGSHGARPDVVLLDELTHQGDDSTFASTLLDNLEKMPVGFGVVATNSGFTDSWQEAWKKTFSQSRRWRVFEHKTRPPWIPKVSWAEAKKRNSPNRYLRLFKGVWTGSTEGALDSDDIRLCTTQRRPMTGKEEGWCFYAGLDIGIRKHATGLVVVGKHVGWSEEIAAEKPPLSHTAEALVDLGIWEKPPEETEYVEHEASGRLRLAYAEAWKPMPGRRVSLEDVRRTIVRLHEIYDLEGLAVDPAQGEHLIELLEKADVPVERWLQTTNSLEDQAKALIECFQQKTLDLYPDRDLIADLKKLQLKDDGRRIRLLSPELKMRKRNQEDVEQAGTGHGDLASALSFAVALARSRNSTRSKPVGDLIIY